MLLLMNWQLWPETTLPHYHRRLADATNLMKHPHQLRPGDIDFVATDQANARRRAAERWEAMLDHGLFVFGAAMFFAAGWLAKGWL